MCIGHGSSLIDLAITSAPSRDNLSPDFLVIIFADTDLLVPQYLIEIRLLHRQKGKFGNRIHQRCFQALPHTLFALCGCKCHFIADI